MSSTVPVYFRNLVKILGPFRIFFILLRVCLSSVQLVPKRLNVDPTKLKFGDAQMFEDENAEY